MIRNSEQGEGKMGCFLLLLVMAALIYLMASIGPVYVGKVGFQDDLDKIASKAGARAWSERMIKSEIVKLAEDHGFKTSGDNVEIVRKRRFEQAARISITVSISQSVALPGYTHLFEFECTSSGLIGSL